MKMKYAGQWELFQRQGTSATNQITTHKQLLGYFGTFGLVWLSLAKPRMSCTPIPNA